MNFLQGAKESVTGAFNTASKHASNLFGKKEEDKPISGQMSQQEVPAAPSIAPTAVGGRRRKTVRRTKKAAKRTMHRSRKGKKSTKHGKKAKKSARRTRGKKHGKSQRRR